MQFATLPAKDLAAASDLSHSGSGVPMASAEIKVALLTGGFDRHYTFGLAMALTSNGVHLDVIGGDGVDSPEMHVTPNLSFLNLRGSKNPNDPLPRKVSRVLSYYARLIRYAWDAGPEIFHILWNNKFTHFDRTLLILYYKFRGRKVVFTAHNVNGARRENQDSFFNRLTLRIQYRLVDHIFVHTQKMKDELVKDYGVSEQATTVIPYGINDAVPQTGLKPAEARQRLGVRDGEKAVLFFGNIRPSKGLEYLLEAFREITLRGGRYRLILAGRPLKEFRKFWEDFRPTIDRLSEQGLVILKNEFIPDEEIELYFKAADVLVLPYTDIFQSGVLFLGYSFGLPVIATDVGSLKEDIVKGRTGFLCKPRDSVDLAKAIERYFDGDLYKNLSSWRQEIQDYANSKHSWNVVAGITRDVYEQLSRDI